MVIVIAIAIAIAPATSCAQRSGFDFVFNVPHHRSKNTIGREMSDIPQL